MRRGKARKSRLYRTNNTCVGDGLKCSFSPTTMSKFTPFFSVERKSAPWSSEKFDEALTRKMKAEDHLFWDFINCAYKEEADARAALWEKQMEEEHKKLREKAAEMDMEEFARRLCAEDAEMKKQFEHRVDFR